MQVSAHLRHRVTEQLRQYLQIMDVYQHMELTLQSVSGVYGQMDDVRGGAAVHSSLGTWGRGLPRDRDGIHY
jgi:hypothetical protein